MICHCIADGLEHYVVLFKAKHGKVWLGDPGAGKITMNMSAFGEWWTGVFFVLVPDDGFQKTNDSRSLLNRFAHLLLRHKLLAVEVLVASLLMTILGIVSAFYYRFLIDEVIYSGLPQALNAVSIGFVLVLLFLALLGFARNQLMLHLGNKIEAALLFEYFDHLLALPMDFFTKRKTGEILSRIGDTETIRHAISSVTIGVVLDSLMLVFGGAVLFSFGVSLVGIAVIPVAISGLLVWLFSKRFHREIKTQSHLEAEKQSHFVETLNGIATVKALSTEEQAFSMAEQRIVASIRQDFTLGYLGNLQGAIHGFISQAGNLAVYWYGSSLIMQGQLSLGQLISFVTLLGYFLGPLGRLISLQPQLQQIRVASDRLGEILDLPTEQTSGPRGCKPAEFKGNIEVQNLSFSYGTRGTTLHAVNIAIQAGKQVAFVGPSGSGKSTTVKLLMKFYLPDEGQIVVDDYHLADWDTPYYRDQIGYVPQEVLLFSGTIADNIAWGREDATMEQIVEAAKAARAHEFISQLPDRYHTRVGERGATLSGGERQRISLARILLRKPRLFILDEATSSLDSVAEAAIMHTIRSVCQGATTIIVAHRLSTIRHCDQIFVFSEGSVVENGTHQELLEKTGLYFELWNSQSDSQFQPPVRNVSMKISVHAIDDVPSTLWRQIRMVEAFAFTQETTAETTPDNTEYATIVWANSDYVIVGRIDGNVVCQCYISRREILVGDRKMLVAGIGGVGTHPDWQKAGFGKQIIQYANDFIAQTLEVAFGLLVCESKTRPFYEKCGWYQVADELLYFHAKEKNNLTMKTTVMILPVKGQTWPEGTIDVCGLPW